jgi:hypothetical protein
MRAGDCGVVRGGMLLIQRQRRSTAVSLVCVGCNERPVQVTPTGHALYCGPACAAADGRRTSGHRRR